MTKNGTLLHLSDEVLIDRLVELNGPILERGKQHAQPCKYKQYYPNSDDCPWCIARQKRLALAKESTEPES